MALILERDFPVDCYSATAPIRLLLRSLTLGSVAPQQWQQMAALEHHSGLTMKYMPNNPSLHIIQL